MAVLQAGQRGLCLIQIGGGKGGGGLAQALGVVGGNGQFLAALQIAQAGFRIPQNGAQMADFGVIGGHGAQGGGVFGLQLGNGTCGFGRQIVAAYGKGRQRAGFQIGQLCRNLVGGFLFPLGIGHHHGHGPAGGFHAGRAIAQLLAQDWQRVGLGQRIGCIMAVAAHQGDKQFEHLALHCYERCS